MAIFYFLFWPNKTILIGHMTKGLEPSLRKNNLNSNIRGSPYFHRGQASEPAFFVLFSGILILSGNMGKDV